MDPFSVSASQLTSITNANPSLGGANHLQGTAGERPKNLYHVALGSDQMRACLGVGSTGNHYSNNHFVHNNYHQPTGLTATDGGVYTSGNRRERSVDSCLSAVNNTQMDSNQSYAAPVRRKHPELVPNDVLKADFRHGDPFSGFTGTMFSSVCVSKPGHVSGGGGFGGIMTRSVTAAPRGRGTPEGKHVPSSLHPDSAGKPKRSVSMSRLDQLSQPKRIYVAARTVKQQAINKDTNNVMTQSVSSNLIGTHGQRPTTSSSHGLYLSRPSGAAARSRPRPKSMFVSSPASASSTPPGSNRGGLAGAKPTPPPKPRTGSRQVSTDSTPLSENKIKPSKSSDPLEPGKLSVSDVTPKSRVTGNSNRKPSTPSSKIIPINQTPKTGSKTSVSSGTTPKSQSQVTTPSRPPKKAMSMSSSMDKLSSSHVNSGSIPFQQQASSDIKTLVEEDITQTQSQPSQVTESNSIQNVDLLSDLESAAKRQREEEEEAKARLAEKRRAAREEAERAAELERQRQADILRQEEEQRLIEEEEQLRMEAEASRLAEEHRLAEDAKLRDAIAEKDRRDREEAERKAEEEKARLEREDRDRKAKEESDRARKDLEERLKKDEEERLARKLKLEAIMSRTRKTPNGKSVPGGSGSGSQMDVSSDDLSSQLSSNASGFEPSTPPQQVSPPSHHDAQHTPTNGSTPHVINTSSLSDELNVKNSFNNHHHPSSSPYSDINVITTTIPSKPLSQSTTTTITSTTNFEPSESGIHRANIITLSDELAGLNIDANSMTMQLQSTHLNAPPLGIGSGKRSTSSDNDVDSGITHTESLLIIED